MAAPILQLGIDLGSSSTKIISAIGAWTSQHLIEPDVFETPRPDVSEMLLSASHPIDRAWVQIEGQPEGYAVGRLAAQYQSYTRIDLLKYEFALYKILGAIGAILEVEQVKGRFELELAALLPMSEYRSKKALFQQLGAALEGFYFGSIKYKGRLHESAFRCSPEGSGLIWGLIQQRGREWLQGKTVCVLMMGHRDVTVITFRNGSIDRSCSQTQQLGFVKFLDRIASRCFGFEPKQSVEAVFKIGNDVSPYNPRLRNLVRSTRPGNIEVEANELSSAIDSARLEYWKVLSNWLEGVIPGQLDLLMVGGGSAPYFKSWIDSHFAWASPTWADCSRMTDINLFFNSCIPKTLVKVS